MPYDNYDEDTSTPFSWSALIFGCMLGVLITCAIFSIVKDNDEKDSSKVVTPKVSEANHELGVYCFHGSPLVPVIVDMYTNGTKLYKFAITDMHLTEGQKLLIKPCPAS